MFQQLHKAVTALAALAALSLVCTSAEAQQASWTDWTSSTANTATGTLNVSGNPVTVSYSGEIAFAQTSGGTNYWNPSAPYISATVPNAPSTPDIIALSQTSTKTLTFSQPVLNPIFAVVSLNANGYQFDRDFEVLSFGTGFWGAGSLTKQIPALNVFQLDGVNEGHGVIQFQGSISSITWNSVSGEFWNGFTVGVVVPEPGTLTLVVPVLAVAGIAVRRKQSGK